MHLHNVDRPCGQVIIVMGVSGSGKTTIGKLLAQSLGCAFIDADDFHSDENKEKMRQGVPLTDMDRMPWLETLRDTLIGYLVSVKAVVLACSALKPSYRQILRVGDLERNFITGKEHEKCEVGCLPNGEIKQHGHYEEQCKERHPTKGPELHPSSCGVKFLLLSGPMDLFASRLKERSKEGSHFMPPSLLQSQFDTLKIGDDEDDIVYLDARLSPEAIVQQAKESLA